MDTTQFLLFPVFHSKISLCKSKYKIYISYKAEISGGMDTNILIEFWFEKWSENWQTVTPYSFAVKIPSAGYLPVSLSLSLSIYLFIYFFFSARVEKH